MSCKYYSNPLQIRGVEEYTLTEGAGRGMRLMRLRNGREIDLTISPDRCSDIVQLFLKEKILVYGSGGNGSSVILQSI